VENELPENLSVLSPEVKLIQRALIGHPLERLALGARQRLAAGVLGLGIGRQIIGRQNPKPPEGMIQRR
jgi:hypothetical protein